MPDLHGFFDKDVFVKLICCDLWSETLQAFALTHPYRLASAGVRECSKIVQKRKRLSEDARHAIIARIAATVPNVAVIPAAWLGAESLQLMNRFQREEIDSGEVELAAVALTCRVENRLVSGDKRFFKAFREGFPAEFETLRPRLVSFEDCLCAVSRTCGFAHVKEKALPALDCDDTLRVALGSGAAAKEATFLEALRAYNPLEPEPA